MQRAAQFAWRRDVARLGKPTDRDEWFMTPQTINAYYNPIFNEIVFPAAILQPPFFDPKADPAVNYGGIGAVIGHETGHAFDDQGRKTDSQGNLQDWWTEGDAKAFKAKAQALVEQYNDFRPLPDLNVNGQLTLGENIGEIPEGLYPGDYLVPVGQALAAPSAGKNSTAPVAISAAVSVEKGNEKGAGLSARRFPNGLFPGLRLECSLAHCISKMGNLSRISGIYLGCSADRLATGPRRMSGIRG